MEPRSNVPTTESDKLSSEWLRQIMSNCSGPLVGDEGLHMDNVVLPKNASPFVSAKIPNQPVYCKVLKSGCRNEQAQYYVRFYKAKVDTTTTDETHDLSHEMLVTAEKIRLFLADLKKQEPSLEIPIIGPAFENPTTLEFASARLQKKLNKCLDHEYFTNKEDIFDNLGFVTEASTIPRMNILILIVGTRGDVQPLLAFAQELNSFGHTCRICTHNNFRDFITENGVRFYPLGGDPVELMAYMVKNPGLIPKDVSEIKKKKSMYTEMMEASWKACYMPDDYPNDDGVYEEFQCDAIISNPPCFSHIHLAERLQVPLHIYFEMPWSPTTEFPHPFMWHARTNINPYENHLSYFIVDGLTWLGMQGCINDFRVKTLQLSEIRTEDQADFILHHLKVPHAYFWSSALVPKPFDWGPHIDVCGFFFLDLQDGYEPPEDLTAFLASGSAPLYIGFGSIVVDEFDKLLVEMFEAIKETGVRALINKGWSEELSKANIAIPDGVFFVGNCPHDWLFQKCCAVVHHGGAGTTAAGLLAGKPSLVVPFFGDQFFWGEMISREGVGPAFIRQKKLTRENFAAAIKFMQDPEVVKKAEAMGVTMRAERGAKQGVAAFHKQLPLDYLRCDVCEVGLKDFKSGDDSAKDLTIGLATIYDETSKMRMCKVCDWVVNQKELPEEKHVRSRYRPINWTWRRTKAQIDNAGEGLMMGMKVFGECLLEGTKGFVSSPLRGAQSGGFIGGLVGAAWGTLRLLYMPLKGTFKLVEYSGLGLIRQIHGQDGNEMPDCIPNSASSVQVKIRDDSDVEKKLIENVMKNYEFLKNIKENGVEPSTNVPSDEDLDPESEPIMSANAQRLADKNKRKKKRCAIQ
eukprot:Platyproteum_vivax@DN6708_c0_g1_i1.p1